ERRLGPQAPWYKRRARARQYVVYVRELKEYIAARANAGRGDPPIARMIGLVETDLGLGLVSEAVRGDDGALAPTLAAVYARNGGFAPWIDRALDAFVDGLLACDVIVGDMHAWNLVYGTDSRGGPRFVMIDGFGEKHVIPRSSMSRRLNAWNTRKLYRRMRRRLVELVPLERAP
ncbi:MAG TPA: YrbL family protein, partial [Dokdonella sp.]